MSWMDGIRGRDSTFSAKASSSADGATFSISGAEPVLASSKLRSITAVPSPDTTREPTWNWRGNMVFVMLGTLVAS